MKNNLIIFKEGESMDYQEIARHFQTTSFDPQPFVQTAIDDRKVREKLVENVVDGQNHINEYFNSYLIIKEVAIKNPELIYDEWERIWALHTHKNSYHRWIAHDLITQLLVIDHEDKFEAIKQEYVLLPKEEKISNFLKMIENIKEASRHKDLQHEKKHLLTDQVWLSNFNEKQMKRIDKVLQTLLTE